MRQQCLNPESPEPSAELHSVVENFSFEVNLPSPSLILTVLTTAAAEKENNAPKVPRITIPRISTKDYKIIWNVRDPDAVDKCLALRGSFKILAQELLLEIADPQDLIIRYRIERI